MNDGKTRKERRIMGEKDKCWECERIYQLKKERKNNINQYVRLLNTKTQKVIKSNK